ncbi:MAG: glycoside hydrolase family 15 protein [Gammaproteobacteria bacterium]
MLSLNLGVIGNCTYGALVDGRARVVWNCLPRFDGDPVFCSLLRNGQDDPRGLYAIELLGLARHEQCYRPNTAVLVTTLHDTDGNAVEIIDFAPRFYLHDRTFKPLMLVRRIRPIAGAPRIRVKLRPQFHYGAEEPRLSRGSNHARFIGPDLVLRLTTNAPLTYVLDETPFVLEQPVSLVLGPDETLAGDVETTARDFEERTSNYWQRWVRRLALPLEYQEAVIRAAITLKLCAYEETGAIVAAMTTSIPEAAHTERNWDYRYCWLRDAFFVIRALNSLSEVETMEHFLRYLTNIVSLARDGNRRDGNWAGEDSGHLQPVYGIGLEHALIERQVDSLNGYRGMGPVRVGNQACEHLQHDVYGNAVLAASQAFFDNRLLAQPTLADFERLELVGRRAYAMHNQPDAGMWELRTRAHVHTSSSLMCWAACDRLAKIASHLELDERATQWRERADTIHKAITENAWDPERQSFVDAFGGGVIDAGLLLMGEVGFIAAQDPRFISTIAAVEGALKRGNHLFRYATADDFGLPHNAFNICTFWYIDALIRVGRRQEAREIFDAVLQCRNPLGLLSEDVDPTTGELWGNFPQTYSLVGIINAATRLSEPWQSHV